MSYRENTTFSPTQTDPVCIRDRNAHLFAAVRLHDPLPGVPLALEAVQPRIPSTVSMGGLRFCSA